MTQQAFPPVSRTTDPDTSHQAEAELAKRLPTVQRISWLVAMQPGKIRSELAASLQMSEYELSKRLSDAERMGLIRKGEPRRSPVTNRMQSTWWPVPQEVK